MDYDLIVAGGGIAGSSLAARMASNGARVLLLERDLQFHDRIRGESVQPWGVAEIRKLGLTNLLQPYCQRTAMVPAVVNGRVAMRRDTVATTMAAEPVWDFFHPTVQEQLLQHASIRGGGSQGSLRSEHPWRKQTHGRSRNVGQERGVIRHVSLCSRQAGIQVFALNAGLR